MSSTTIPTNNQHYPSPPEPESPLGPRKTLFVLVTVVGCIAILWPKIFYPMMFSSSSGGPPVDNFIEKKGFQPGDLRQERPPHMRTGHIHPAMIERGRAIPNTPSVPIVERTQRAQDAPTIIEGRPGPIPGLRPPMGAGAVHQANQKGGSSMGFIMPLYTIGIVAFFVYTIMKLVMKKTESQTQYPNPTKPDPTFKEQVFQRGNNKIGNIGWKEHDTIVTAIQGLIDAADEQLYKRENSPDLRKDATENNEKQNGHAKLAKDENNDNNSDIIEKANNSIEVEQNDGGRHKRDISADRTLKVLGLEMTASCEGGHKLSRPVTPILNCRKTFSEDSDKPTEPPQSIYLEGALPHDSQILIADAETKPDGVYDDQDTNGNPDEPAVILSSKMTLSLINLDPVNSNNGHDDPSSHEQSDNDDDDGNDVENLH